LSRDFKKELEGFERVWKRVCQSGSKLPENMKLMPQKAKKGGRRPGI